MQTAVTFKHLNCEEIQHLIGLHAPPFPQSVTPLESALHDKDMGKQNSARVGLQFYLKNIRDIAAHAY